MGYLVMEILLYMVVAFAIGIGIGWLVWGFKGQQDLSTAKSEANAAISRARAEAQGGGESGAVEALEAKLAECAAARERLEGELSGCNAARSKLEGELDGARTALAAMEKDLAAASAEPEPAPVPEPEPAPKPKPAPDPAPQAEETASTPAATDAPPPETLLAERPDEVDDLKQIKGVGPKMEGILNDKGIYLFRQLANFTARDVEWVNAAIEAFPGRIERDDWVGQAQALYKEKYGKSHDAD